MEDSPFPPWSASPDENPASQSEGFALADQVLQALASRGDGKIIERHYWISREWGKILRSKVSLPVSQAAHVVNCWYVSDSEVAIATKVDDDWEPTQSGA